MTRYPDSDVHAPAHAFVSFARRTPLLFAFHAPIEGGTITLADKARWPLPQAVVLAQAERLTSDVAYQPMADSFSGWVAFVVQMCQQRAGA